MDGDDSALLLGRRMSKLSPDERELFEENALYVMPTWRRTVPIIVNYLKKLVNPVARCDIVYEISAGRRNHALKDVSLPARVPLAVGAKVMLVVNEVVEEGLQNGSVGTIK